MGLKLLQSLWIETQMFLGKFKKLADIICFHIIGSRLHENINVPKSKGLLTFMKDDAVFTMHIPEEKPLIWYPIFEGIMDYFGFDCIGECIGGDYEDTAKFS